MHASASSLAREPGEAGVDASTRKGRSSDATPAEAEHEQSSHLSEARTKGAGKRRLKGVVASPAGIREYHSTSMRLPTCLLVALVSVGASRVRAQAAWWCATNFFDHSDRACWQSAEDCESKNNGITHYQNCVEQRNAAVLSATSLVRGSVFAAYPELSICERSRRRWLKEKDLSKVSRCEVLASAETIPSLSSGQIVPTHFEIAAHQKGDVTGRILVYDLVCEKASCLLRILTLNQCMNLDGGAPAFVPKIEFVTPQVVDDGKTFTATVTAETLGQWTLVLEFAYRDGRVLSGFRGIWRKQSEVLGKTLTEEYEPVRAGKDSRRQLGCPVLLPSIP